MVKLIKISPRDAIDAFCSECIGNKGASMEDIRSCTAPKCPLFHYRPYQNKGERVGCWTQEQFEGARGYSCFTAEKRAKIMENATTSEELDEKKALRTKNFMENPARRSFAKKAQKPAMCVGEGVDSPPDTPPNP